LTVSFVCVLFDGGEDVPEWSRVYDERWVDRLHRGISRNLWGCDFEVVCLTDRRRRFDTPTRQVALEAKRPNWTALLEAFRPDLGIERGFLLGLDTVIVGSLAPLAGYSGEFAMLSDPYNPTLLCNGVTAFSRDGGARAWEAWRASGTQRFELGGLPSEMVFLRDAFPAAERLDRLYPGQIASYKCHVRPEGLGADVRVVYFHGQPKPDELLAESWVREHWR
jgi:hypothetical protein